MLSSGFSVKAFSGTEYGEEYLSFGQNERIRRSSTLEEGWAWGWLDDSSCGWFPPDFWREVEDQHLSCPCAISCLDTSKFLIVDDVAAGGSPVDEELQTCMSDDRDINISVV